MTEARCSGGPSLWARLPRLAVCYHMGSAPGTIGHAYAEDRLARDPTETGALRNGPAQRALEYAAVMIAHTTSMGST